jgi:hypothetical protein
MNMSHLSFKISLLAWLSHARPSTLCGPCRRLTIRQHLVRACERIFGHTRGRLIIWRNRSRNRPEHVLMTESHARPALLLG